jgi:hypothetical protein
MADTFPTVQKPASRKHTFQHKQQRREFEDGYVSSRKVFTKGMWKWELSWDWLPKLDAWNIQAHFNTNLGSVFTASADLLGTDSSYSVRYTDSSLDIESTDAPGFFKVKLNLEQAL